MPAERLRRGGAVLGAGGAVLTLSDLRHLTLPAEMFRRLGLAAPVLVAAGALAPGVPSVPLLLGPAQLVRQAGGWLAAASLVDGIGVRHRDRGVRMVLLGHGGDAPILAAGAMLAPAGTMPAGPGAAGATGAGLIPACEALLRLADASGHPTRHLDGYVDHADRFGLSQLHQLRGRVGRGAAESACVLLYSAPLSQMARNRLKVIYENTDGFEIARQDLALRGPGEFIGARQSGMPLLRYADLDDAELVEHARAAAELLLHEYPEAEQAHLQRWLAGREELLKA